MQRPAGFRLATSSLMAVICGLAIGQATSKPTIPIEQYDSWQTLGMSGLSPDGKWLFVDVRKMDGSSVLTIRQSDAAQRWEIPNAISGRFNKMSSYAGYTIGFSRVERELLAKQKKPALTRFCLRRLSDGHETVFQNVSSWQFTKDGSKALAMQISPDGKSRPATLLIIDLKDGSVSPIHSIDNFMMDREGQFVVTESKSAAGTTSIQKVDLTSLSTKPLLWGEFSVEAWALSKDSSTLVLLRGEENPKKEGAWTDLAVVSAVNTANPKVRAKLSTKEIPGFPEGHRITRLLNMTDDGSRLAFGTQEWKDRVQPVDPSTLSNVEIWHSKDTVVQPLQKNQANAERAAVDTYVWSIGDNGLKKVSKAGESTNLLFGLNHALVYDDQKHATSVRTGGLAYVDVYLADIWGGSRKLILEKAIQNVGGLGAATLSASPKGNYLAYFAGKDWFIFDIVAGSAKNATESSKVDFRDTEDDRTIPAKPAAGNPRWLKDDSGVFFSTMHDVFEYTPVSHQIARLTDGKEEDAVFRITDFGLDEEGLNGKDPRYFTVFDRQSKGTGFAVREAGQPVKVLTFDQKRIRFAGKSEDTDRVLFRMESFTDSPGLFLSNLTFSQAKPVMGTNPQQAEFAWGSAGLIHYNNKQGQKLDGILFKPANHRSDRAYPMVVIVYEKLSDELHNYRMPGQGQQYDVQHFVQNGYFVLMPDITYQPSDPGVSAVDCIESAVKAALKADTTIDKHRVGLTGHSWGGYQTVYLATQSKMFAAYVAGAPLTEYIAMYNSFYWNWGETNQVIFESSQGRMEKAWFDDVDSYIRNSPLFHAKNIQAPILVEAGTVDGAVDWTQAQFLYNTLRRMGKEMILLVYPGENHGLSQRANVKDFSRRIYHFFDVHLKAPDRRNGFRKG
ncbi:prolyl oligopeptidase family serine peptidase [Kamptonema cortianum]|nr:prolyl oligopeptidase family serine peptidase [Kamptonema cortianum]